ncbi:hypothetical protein PoB_000071200 [Plakobranchus ocellatus]|uniref:Uncharacterized protein n=1 Tax=Plakobranchus ocellatus TaxID=259542 RepID=A0AAV3XUL3_9GAST|nr:hypothetical protein PoB_000071200 [Plakobranchus ocellatus]
MPKLPCKENPRFPCKNPRTPDNPKKPKIWGENPSFGSPDRYFETIAVSSVVMKAARTINKTARECAGLVQSQKSISVFFILYQKNRDGNSKERANGP